jgi:protoporphyrinogen oxidase
MKRQAIVIGAGPAGLTAALELLERTDVIPVVVEMSAFVGGLSRTEVYNGNRIDLGGHRFFSKSRAIMDWWQRILPLQGRPARDDIALGRSVPLSGARDAPDPERTDEVMLVRQRVSRIYHLRGFFDYPIALNWDTFRNLGCRRAAKIGMSYIRARAFPREVRNLEDFFVNRFGADLYKQFFKDYTEKVWGRPCRDIGSEWGAQRIKGVSLGKALKNAITGIPRRETSITQRDTETSLIQRFLYPKLGPGQLWEAVARKVSQKGGAIHRNCRVTGIVPKGTRIAEVHVRTDGGTPAALRGDYVLCSMPVKDLITQFRGGVPADVEAVARGLVYRNLLTVGVLARKLVIKNTSMIPAVGDLIPDNWIYIQEPDVRMGRLQIFNNWSPYLVRDPSTAWMGAEYFCSQGDDLWNREDRAVAELAVRELSDIGILNGDDVLDHVVLRTEKAYPAYFDTYERFGVVRSFADQFENLFLIGRNGMHRYNNMDHSMLAAMAAADNIARNVRTKDDIWAVNAEEEYHEGA